MTHVIRDLNETLPIPEAGIASTPLLELPGAAKVVLFALDRGQELSPHAAPFPAEIVLLAGALDVMVGETWTSLTPDQLVALPKGATHAVRAQAPSHFLLTLRRGAA